MVAETFLAAFAKPGGYDARRRDARPWLYGIATNLVGQHRRAEIRRYQLQAAARVDSAPFDQAERIVADVTARQTRPLLIEALASLPGRDRDVELLIASEELTYDEVACALDIPVGTVRSRLNRAPGDRAPRADRLGGRRNLRGDPEP